MIRRRGSMTAVYLIRHGLTGGNIQHRYVGRTDEPLCENGIQQICAQKRVYEQELSTTDDRQVLNKIYVSPMQRCRQTAQLLFPGVEQEEIADFQEMDFGAFEYRNYLELAGDPRYQAFIDSGGQLDFPEAESQEHFRTRVVRAFRQCMMGYPATDQNDGDGVCVFVVHGGTIMAIMEAYAVPHRSYFDWQIPAGAGYYCEVEQTGNGFRLMDVREIKADKMVQN